MSRSKPTRWYQCSNWAFKGGCFHVASCLQNAMFAQKRLVEHSFHDTPMGLYSHTKVLPHTKVVTNVLTDTPKFYQCLQTHQLVTSVLTDTPKCCQCLYRHTKVLPMSLQTNQIYHQCLSRLTKVFSVSFQTLYRHILQIAHIWLSCNCKYWNIWIL